MALTPATKHQIPEESILDTFYRQTYLGNSFILPTTVALSTTSETDIVLISNPAISTSAFPSKYKSLFFNLRRFTSSAQAVLIKIYVSPTVSTTGTASTPVNLRPANTNVSISKAYQNGQFSLSSNGTLVSALGVGGSDFVVQDNQILIIIDPGQSLLITATALVQTTNLNADISWYEL